MNSNMNTRYRQRSSSFLIHKIHINRRFTTYKKPLNNLSLDNKASQNNKLRQHARQFHNTEKHRNLEQFDVSSGHCRSEQAGACVSATSATSALQPSRQSRGFNFATGGKHISPNTLHYVGIGIQLHFITI
jgi:hypothetical protein